MVYNFKDILACYLSQRQIW